MKLKNNHEKNPGMSLSKKILLGASLFVAGLSGCLEENPTYTKEFRGRVIKETFIEEKPGHGIFGGYIPHQYTMLVKLDNQEKPITLNYSGQEAVELNMKYDENSPINWGVGDTYKGVPRADRL